MAYDDYSSGDDGWDFGPGNYQDANYSGGTGLDDFDSNLFNKAPDQNWFSQTYGDNAQLDNVPFIQETNWNPNAYQSDMFQGQNTFGQGIQPSFGDMSVGQYGNQGNLTQPLENGGWNLGGISNTLGSLFSGQGGKGLASIIGALVEGNQNKKAAKQNPAIINQMRRQASPFDVSSTGASQMGASSMRDAMQQKLAAAMQDPYGQPMVREQVDALAKAQAIKDAAAGRRSNLATSSPALIAEQAKVAQNYINSLYNPAGANMHAGMGGLEQLLAANRAGINGYASPIMSAIGYNQGGSNNTDYLNALRTLLQGNK